MVGVASAVANAAGAAPGADGFATTALAPAAVAALEFGSAATPACVIATGESGWARGASTFDPSPAGDGKGCAATGDDAGAALAPTAALAATSRPAAAPLLAASAASIS